MTTVVSKFCFTCKQIQHIRICFDMTEMSTFLTDTSKPMSLDSLEQNKMDILISNS